MLVFVVAIVTGMITGIIVNDYRNNHRRGYRRRSARPQSKGGGRPLEKMMGWWFVEKFCCSGSFGKGKGEGGDFGGVVMV